MVFITFDTSWGQNGLKMGQKLAIWGVITKKSYLPFHQVCVCPKILVFMDR